MSDPFDSPASDIVDYDAREKASTASTLGLIAIILCLVAPCSSCLTLLVALPMSLVTMSFARTALEGDPDEVTVAYGRTGMTLGVISLVYSLLMLLLAFAYVMLYVVIIGAAIAGA